MNRLSKALFWLARSWIGGLIVGWSFAHLSHWMPLERLDETERVVAFYHPRPSYRVHVLLVPKRPFSSLLTLAQTDADILVDVHSIAQQLVTKLELEESGYSLIVNGGARQDVKQLHWHLIAD